MKGIIFVFLLGLFNFPEAFASRSRMYALGQDPNLGSFYIEDNRNIFRNAANINRFRNYATGELQFKGKENESILSLAPQGGYFTEIGFMATGVYLGQSTIEGLLTSANVFSATPTNLFIGIGDSNPINLFIGNDSGIEWGFNLRIANAKKESAGSESTYQGIGLAAGAIIGNFGFYFDWDISDESKVTGSNTAENGTFENGGFLVGLTYKLSSTTLFAQVLSDVLELSGRATSTENGKAGGSAGVIGAGHIYEVSEISRLNFNLQLNLSKIQNSGKTQTLKSINLPFVFGMEVDATSWLVLRGSARQIIIIGETEIEKYGQPDQRVPTYNSTAVNLGATFNFGKLKVDGNLGMDNVSLFSTEAFFANASVTYWF